jgi:DNA polymerase elongation subunit (family B)
MDPALLSDAELLALKHELENDVARYDTYQQAVKVCANSQYGALGNAGFIFYDRRLTMSITLSGQAIIRTIANAVNAYLNKILKTQGDYIVYSHTDSVVVSCAELVRQSFDDKIPDTVKVIDFLDRVGKAKFQQVIDKAIGKYTEYTNAKSPEIITVKREMIADKSIFIAKARYICRVYDNEGLRYTTPKLKMTGLEMIKSSTPHACRQKLREAVNVILNNSNAKLIDFVDQFKEEFKTLPLADTAFPRGVNGLEHYSTAEKSIPIHVQGSLTYNRLLKKKGLDKEYPAIHEGEKVRFIYLKEPNPSRSHVIAFPNDVLPSELGLAKYIDFDKQFEVSFIGPLNIILKPINWTSTHISSLESFFT